MQELGIAWIAAQSSPAKGRIERSFQTAQDRLVKGLRVAGASTLEQANAYLLHEYLRWREREMTVEAGHPDDAHRDFDLKKAPKVWQAADASGYRTGASS